MKRGFIRSGFNRLLHLAARYGPGGSSLRPLLHRARGVRVHGRVWIGDEVYLENEHPECIELHDGANISLRAMIIAHTKGEGMVVVERDAFIGPGSIILCAEGREVRIGQGAVVTAGCIITASVPPGVVMSQPKCSPIAQARVPFPVAKSMDVFLGGLEPLDPPD